MIIFARDAGGRGRISAKAGDVARMIECSKGSIDGFGRGSRGRGSGIGFVAGCITQCVVGLTELFKG